VSYELQTAHDGEKQEDDSMSTRRSVTSNLFGGVSWSSARIRHLRAKEERHFADAASFGL
jgi:hypothetical protein